MCMLKSMSLFFFKCRHLLLVLKSLTEVRPNERDFWLRTEDYILRVKNQYSVSEISQIVSIYSKVKPSQLFWIEVEQILLSKSSEFRK